MWWPPWAAAECACAKPTCAGTGPAHGDGVSRIGAGPPLQLLLPPLPMSVPLSLCGRHPCCCCGVCCPELPPAPSSGLWEQRGGRPVKLLLLLARPVKPCGAVKLGAPAAAASRAMKLPVGGEQPNIWLPVAGEAERHMGLPLLLPGVSAWGWSLLATLCRRWSASLMHRKTTGGKSPQPWFSSSRVCVLGS